MCPYWSRPSAGAQPLWSPLSSPHPPVVTSADLRGLPREDHLIPEGLSLEFLFLHVGGAALSIHGTGHVGKHSARDTTPQPADHAHMSAKPCSPSFSSIVPAEEPDTSLVTGLAPGKHVERASAALWERVPHPCWGGGPHLQAQVAEDPEEPPCMHTFRSHPLGSPESQPGS